MNFIKKISILLICLFCSHTAQAEWVKQNSETMAWLRTVYFVNEKTGWIGGSGGTLLETTDGGKYWSRLRNFTSDTIRQIYFSDEKNGWILCEKDVFGLGSNPPSYLMKTNNGGISWEQVNFTGGRRERIADIFFTENGLGFAVGEAGAFFALQSDSKTWKKQAPPIHFLMLDGAFTDDFNGIIVGAGGSILFTDDAGMSWTRANVQGESRIKLNSVCFTNQKNGWAVGAQGKIFQTINGGRFWREQKSGVTVELNDVFFLDTAEGWAIGDDGMILHTTTGGNVWTIKNSRIGHRLEKLFFAGKSGWAVGFGGTILRYDKGKQNLSKSAPFQVNGN